MAQEPEVAEEVTEEGAEAAPKKTKKKLIIIIAVVALVLIGGGVTAWLLMGDKHAEEGEHAESSEEHEAVAAKEPVFVKLDTFTVNLNPEEGDKYLQVDITLNASSKDEADALDARMPQVRNRVLMVLTSKLASEISDTEGKQMLIAELTESINEPYGEGAEPLNVSEAFFTSFVIQ